MEYAASGVRAGFKPEFNMSKGVTALKGLTSEEQYLATAPAVAVLKIAAISDRNMIEVEGEGMPSKRFSRKWFERNKPTQCGYLLLQRNGNIRFLPAHVAKAREAMVAVAWEESIYNED